MPENTPLCQVKNLKKYYQIKDHRGRKGVLKAVDGVSFNLHQGETFGLVGETGCGKSTLGRSLLNIFPIDGGEIVFDGQNIAGLTGKDKKHFCHNVQLVFQDPSACLNPRRRVGDILSEPFKIHSAGKLDKQMMHARIDELLTLVGLSAEYKNRYPHEMSGGQKQRIGIARALALRPKLIVCDEPVSALDVSIQAQVINLLKELQEKMDLAYLFISHDLGVVYHMCQNIAVMYLGKVVEIARKSDLYQNPMHPYTKALISAVPSTSGHRTERAVISGDLPNPSCPPPGCKFHTRCPDAQGQCALEEPELSEIGEGHFLACHLYAR